MKTTNTTVEYRIEYLCGKDWWRNLSGSKTEAEINDPTFMEACQIFNPGVQLRKVKVTITTTEEIEVLP